MKPTPARLFRALQCLQHDNPLGLPKKGTIPPFRRGLPEKRPIRDVRRVVAVSSAKGGVGKSTVAANLALAFARLGYRAGILDTDLFGPSIPTLFNLSGEPRLTHDDRLVPLTAYGVKTMSIGYLLPADSAGAPVAWRGLMVSKALEQLLHSVDWSSSPSFSPPPSPSSSRPPSGSPLDVLVLDLPPGTGDVQLSIAQSVRLAGSVVVTTPHTLSVVDARRGVGLWRKVGVPILGVVENMGAFVCPCCGTRSSVFGESLTGERLVRELAGGGDGEEEVPFLGSIPLDPKIADDAQRGKPTVAAAAEGERAKVFVDIAKRLAGDLRLNEEDR